jgi:TatD DNase family protein
MGITAVAYRLPMAYWVDFHTHILDSPDLSSIEQDCRAQHVNTWLVNSVDLDNHTLLVKNASSFPSAIVGVGWHPEQVIETPESRILGVLKKYEGLMKKAPYLGETGLDFWYGKTLSQQSAQKKVFARFIDWSNEHEKLIEVHTRHAKQESLDLLSDKNAERVILHWFSGNQKQQQLIISRKWVVTVGPTILNSPHLNHFIERQPLELLGLETDSPIPFDGKPSSPAWIPQVAQRVAEIKNVSLREVNEAQSSIFSRFFPGFPINPFGGKR